jgi:hypothetical protein
VLDEGHIKLHLQLLLPALGVDHNMVHIRLHDIPGPHDNLAILQQQRLRLPATPCDIMLKKGGPPAQPS